MTSFLLCFSVDAVSSGAALAATAFGPNVRDQGFLGNMQAAGDAFITTEAFTRAGISGGPSLGLFNNVLVINQSPVYVNDFGLLQLLGSDEIDALVVFDDDGDGVFGGSDQVLFSLAAG